MNTKLIVPAVLISMIVACGKSDNGDGGDDTSTTGTVSSGGSTSGEDPIPADVPSDSTGAIVSTTLRFGQATGGTALALQAPVTLDLGGGIVLSDARVNVVNKIF